VEPACRAGHDSPYFGNASNVPRSLPADVSYSSRCRSTQNLDPSPSLGDLGWFCSGELAFTWAMPACFLLLHLAPSRNRSNSPSPIAVRLDRNGIISCPLLVASASSILLPIFIWLISHWVKPIFVGRYMIPTLIGMACATAHYVNYLLGPQIRGAPPGTAAAGSSSRPRPLILSRAALLFLLGSVAFPVLYALDR
jgi:hypothetical protein